MNLQKCPNGHYYNIEKFPYCPHCSNSAGKTDSLNDSKRKKLPTENIQPMSPATTPSFLRLTAGWLVCLSGYNRGISYPIYPGDNHIGRNSNMNIRLKEEPTISREDHAILHYDADTLTFSLIPKSTANPSSVNDNVLTSERTLHDRDLIQLGECQLLFVALCDEHFCW